MKLFKKLSAVLIALVLAFAMFAFAACGGGDDSDPNDNNENNNQQQGGGSGGGGNEGGSGGSSDDTGDDADEVTPASIVAALEKAEIKFINFGFAQTAEAYESKGSSEEDAKANEAKTQTLTSNDVCTIDYVNDNFDMHSTSSIIHEDSANGSDSYENNYMFKRGDFLFVYNQSDEEATPDDVTDWSDKALSICTERQYGIINLLVNNMQSLGMLPRINIALVNLAKQTNSITIADGKATVDLNKLVDKALEEIDADLQTVSSTTTLGAALEKDAIKTYLSILVNVLTADEIVSLAKLYLSTPGAPTYPLYTVFDGEDKVSPDANSTAWEYLIKLLKSEQLKGAVQEVLTGMGIEGTITADSLYEVSCKYVMGLVGQIMSKMQDGSGGSSSNIPNPQPGESQGNQGAGQPQPTLADTTTEPEEDEVKDALEVVHDLSEAATAGKVVYVVNQYAVTTYTLTNMKLEYTLNGSDITAMKLSYNSLTNSVMDNTEADPPVTPAYSTMKYDSKDTYSLTFADTGTIIDISEFKTDAVVYSGEMTNEIPDPTNPDNNEPLSGIEGVKKAEVTFSVIDNEGSKEITAAAIKFNYDDDTVKKVALHLNGGDSGPSDGTDIITYWTGSVKIDDDTEFFVQLQRVVSASIPVMFSIMVVDDLGDIESGLFYAVQESTTTATVKAYLAAFAA